MPPGAANLEIFEYEFNQKSQAKKGNNTKEKLDRESLLLNDITKLSFFLFGGNFYDRFEEGEDEKQEKNEG